MPARMGHRRLAERQRGCDHAFICWWFCWRRGEESLAAIVGLHMATATALNTCTALRISRNEMIRVMHDEPAFADVFLKFLLDRSMRT
jgi:hypothetical protein